jgi:hypothetical protein
MGLSGHAEAEGERKAHIGLEAQSPTLPACRNEVAMWNMLGMQDIVLSDVGSSCAYNKK